jgi:hypothetical protein
MILQQQRDIVYAFKQNQGFRTNCPVCRLKTNASDELSQEGSAAGMTRAEPALHAIILLQVADSTRNIANVLGMCCAAVCVIWCAGLIGVW